jgi:hypothetical protein
MRDETKYILGEIEHLLSFGMKPDYICRVLNRQPTAINKLAYRNGRPDLGRPFTKKKEK